MVWGELCILPHPLEDSKMLTFGGLASNMGRCKACGGGATYLGWTNPVLISTYHTVVCFSDMSDGYPALRQPCNWQ